jgi:hypothetical protein
MHRRETVALTDYTATIETTTADGITTSRLILTPISEDTNNFSVPCTLMKIVLDELFAETAENGSAPEFEIYVDIPDTQTNFIVTIQNLCINVIAGSEISRVEIASSQVSVSFDAAALDAMVPANDGVVTLSVARTTVPDAVQADIGDRRIQLRLLPAARRSRILLRTARFPTPIRRAGRGPGRLVIYYTPRQRRTDIVPSAYTIRKPERSRSRRRIFPALPSAITTSASPTSQAGIPTMWTSWPRAASSTVWAAGCSNPRRTSRALSS